MMDYQQALAYIDGVQWYGSRPGLERVSELLKALGDPQEDLRCIHVAGTNGKGSCAAMTEAVLRAAGLRTGLFTSPYLWRFNERMQLCGRPIDDESLAALVSRIQPLADAMDDHPTEFELMTAAAFLWFKERGCQALVLEVGLGGRLDATNVIRAPAASVIMNIGLDHTQVLGDSIPQIAGEKAGIIKAGCPVLLYPQSREAEAVVARRCRELDAPLYQPELSLLASVSDSLEGQVFTYRGQRYRLPLLGDHQLRNAAVVLELVDLLRAQGWDLPPQAVEQGLASVVWPARFELVHRSPWVIVDGGHNAQCAQTVADNLLRYFPGRRRILLTGVLADKDYPALYDELQRAADAYVCVTPNSSRALEASALADFLRSRGRDARACGSVAEGLALAMDLAGEEGVVCAVGSLYMAGQVRACFSLYD